MMIQYDDCGLPEGQASRLQAISQLPSSVWRDFERHAKRRRQLKGRAIFEQGSPFKEVAILLSGRGRFNRRVNALKESPTAMLRLVGPGAIVGLDHQIQSLTTWNVSFTPLMALEVLSFPVATFSSLMATHESLRHYAFQCLAEELRQLQEDRSIQKFSLEARIAFFLAERLSPLSPMRVSRRDISDWVGASQEAVIRQLSAWTRLGWISTTSQIIALHEPMKLRSLYLDGPSDDSAADCAQPDEPN